MFSFIVKRINKKTPMTKTDTWVFLILVGYICGIGKSKKLSPFISPCFARACPSKTETDNEEKEREDKLAEIELKMVLDELEQKENNEEDIDDKELINEELKKEKKGTSSNTEEINDKDAFDCVDFGDFS